jgi:tetratricopeptide (TPR) repeat protein
MTSRRPEVQVTVEGEPPDHLRALLAFGQPLREGLELVRENKRGTAVVLGTSEEDAALYDQGYSIDLPASAEEILRGSFTDGALILNPELDRIVRVRTFLRPRSVAAVGEGGSRHLFAARFARETGRIVVVVSEERQTITVFCTHSRHLLRLRSELRVEVDDLMSALREKRHVVDDAGRSVAIRQASLAQGAGLLVRLRSHFAELGASAHGLKSQCDTIEAVFAEARAGLDGQPVSGEKELVVVHRSDVHNVFSGTATRDVVQVGSVRTLTINQAPVELPQPRQLPPAIPHFAGRDAELAWLEALLSVGDGTPKIGLVTGAAGLGKTALVVHCAHQVADRFPDGVLYVDLRGFDPAGPPAKPAELIGGLLTALGVPAPAIPADSGAALSLYRSWLHGRRYLVVLDNAREAGQVRPLVPGTPTCGVLVTSRNELPGLVAGEGARTLTLGVLGLGQALDLLTGITGGNLGGEPLTRLAALYEGHPLALCLSGARAARMSDGDFADFVTEVESGLLGAVSPPAGGSESVRVALSLSYAALPPPCRKAFQLLGLYPGPTLSRAVAELLAGDLSLLHGLLDVHLLERAGRGRYRFHDLVRAYAAECSSELPAGERRAALRRVQEWFRDTAEACDRTVDRWRPRMSTGAVRGDGRAGGGWFDSELDNLAAVTRSALEAGEWELTWQLALAPAAYFFSRKPWATWIEIQEAGRQAARQAGQREAEGWLCDGLGVAHREQGRPEDAFRLLNAAIVCFQQAGCRLGEAEAHLHLAQVKRERQEFPEARRQAQAASAAYEAAGFRHGVAKAANLLGGIHLAEEHPEQALAATVEAVGLFTALDDEHGRAWALSNLGTVQARLGRRDEAVAASREAEDIRRRIDRYGLAFTLQSLAELLAEADPAEADRIFIEALEIFEEFGDPKAEQVRARLEHGDLDVTTDLEIVRDLRVLSDQRADEVDVAANQGLDGAQRRLSAGLHVRRTVHDQVLDLVQPADYDLPVLVQGAAGAGKSSLLWALYGDLRKRESIDAYLLDSPWLAGAGGRAPRVPPSAVRAATELAVARGRVAVYLIDTVDLLLHDEQHRQEILDLCDLITVAGGEVVLTSRPEETAVLPRGAFRSVVLGPYDQDELPAAVASHAAAFCLRVPDRSRQEKTEEILGAVARGLPLREIVLNPLKLRLLFELYAPYFPGLEHDVSSLYAEYWERRVHTDRRAETELGTGKDLSPTAENAGIALLATGRIELGERLLLRTVASVATGRNQRDQAEPEAVSSAVTTLVRRGVLARSDASLRFFHQTMFEYAASRGLLARDGAGALTFLLEHLRAHPDDLFVGAVAEQALVLAVDEPFLAEDAATILADLAGTGSSLFQRIALGVLAHRPTRAETTEQLIDNADTAALRRFAQTIPTVVKEDIGPQVALLERVWHRDVSVRESVLQALERLAGTDPALVTGALRRLECVSAALAWRNDPAGMVRLTARVVTACAVADPGWARAALFLLFDTTIRDTTHRATPRRVLELFAANWGVLGSPDTYPQIETRVVRAQGLRDAEGAEMRRILGRLQALTWADRLAADDGAGDWWTGTVTDLCARLESDHRDVLANARLHAIAELIAGGALSTGRAIATMTRLGELRGDAPFALGWLFRPLLRAGTGNDGAAAVLPWITGLLDGLPAEGNNIPEGPQRFAHAARQAIREADLDPAEVARLLADVPSAQQVANLLDQRVLAGLLVPAALGGHFAAEAALEHAKTARETLSPTVQRILSYDLAPHLEAAPGLLTFLVELSISRRSTQPLSEVVNQPADTLVPELRSCSARLGHLIHLLNSGSGAQQKEAASLWRRLHRLEAVEAPTHDALVAQFHATPVPAARGNLLELATDIALSGKGDPVAAERFLRAWFDVDASTGAIVSPGTTVAGQVAKIARSAWLRLRCRRSDQAGLDLGEVFGVATADPVEVDTLAVFGGLITGLARSGEPGVAADVLLRLAKAAAELLSPKQENTLANRMRSPVRVLLRASSPQARRAVVAQAPRMPRTLARIVVSAAAQEDFDGLRPALAGLLSERLPEGVEQQIHDEIRVRSREVARGTLPRLLRPLTDDEE